MITKGLFFFALLYLCESFFTPSSLKKHGTPFTGYAGEPLILTPLIRENKIREARVAATVNFEGFLGIKSFSGYLTVDEIYNSNLFFWFFPSQNDYENDPVLLWLQGGPGSPSMYAVFQEHGPFVFKDENTLGLAKETWTRNHSVIYIDSPAGTGWSYTTGGYAQNQTKVGRDLHEALQQFFTLFPELVKNEFFITGESYGGKYVPALAYTILKQRGLAKVEINLKGLAIGNGMSDPEHQIKYANYAYQHGFVDSTVRDAMAALEERAVEHIRNEEYVEASDLMNQDFGGEGSLFYDASGISNVYNYLNAIDDGIGDAMMDKYFSRADVREALHVGSTTFGDENVYANLEYDIPKPITSWVAELLSHYRILFYNGQLDIIVAYPMMVEYLQALNFSSAEEYKVANRYQWYVGDDLAGYVKYAGNLTEVLVRNAGHMVPADQPVWASDLITKFTRNKVIHL
ncbi:unnamed protein product [Phaedon cochleariae]|uniref:Carboxypeptidase n=1 Tax=Phaedon cochleariae TaxID=80249 RepID=A0A9P0DXY9_PHACE|nr:unnamed protein product [Phaedon cochleariae]